MNARQMRDLPVGLERIRRRLEGWRQTHKAHSRIPESLWTAAVKAAGTFGIHRTANALRLDYYALKKRIDQNAVVADNPKARSRGAGDSKEHASPAFLELTPLTSAGPCASASPCASVGPCECVVELENVSGDTMRMQMKGVAMSDAALLCRSFWNPGP